MSLVRRVFVTLDCAEPSRLAEFWAAMLGGGVVFSTSQAVGVRAEHVWLSAMRVDGYRSPTWPEDTVPKQVHLDLDVEDLDAAIVAAERLGAAVAQSSPHPRRAGSCSTPPAIRFA